MTEAFFDRKKISISDRQLAQSPRGLHIVCGDEESLGSLHALNTSSIGFGYSHQCCRHFESSSNRVYVSVFANGSDHLVVVARVCGSGAENG